MIEQNTKLPKDWKWSKIGDIVEMQSGMAFKKAEYSTEGVRLFQIANVSFNYTKWDYVEHLPIEYIESHNHLLLKKGDIVLALNRPMLNNQLKIAELKHSDVPAILYQRVGRFIFKEIINKSYFLYYFQSPIFLKWLSEQLQGVNIPFINKSKLFSFDKFPLPPLETQQTIVSKIEELFSELDKGIEDLKTAQQQLKTYRQSVLKWAFEGNLTNENVKDGKLPKGWEILKIKDICEIKGGKNQSKVINPNGKYPIYGSSGIFGYADEYICDENTTIVGRKGNINSPLFVSTKFWNVDTAFGLCVNYKYDSKLLFYFCLGFNFKKLDKSTTIPSLAKSDILSIDIQVPPSNEQLKIVQEIESRLSVADKMEESIVQSLLQAEALRQSILKKAFSGELV